MPLVSHLFRGDRALEACSLHDSAHIMLSAIGVHVRKIQAALEDLDEAKIDPGEIASKRYGATTAAAVLSFKRKRNIVNRSYQTTEDNIVGKMTIAAMDKELVAKQEMVAPRLRPHCKRS